MRAFDSIIANKKNMRVDMARSGMNEKRKDNMYLMEKP